MLNFKFRFFGILFFASPSGTFPWKYAYNNYKTLFLSSHPYLFFNQDHTTMTFFGFNVDITGNLFDADTQQIIKENIMSTELYRDISRQMPGCLNTNYKNLNR